MLISPFLVPTRQVKADDTTTSLSTGGTPMGIAYDPQGGKLFIATASAVVVTDGSAWVIDTIPSSSSMQFPCSLVYVPTTNEVFVANCGGDASRAITIIDARTDAIVGTIPLMEQPFGIAYDSNTDQVFVADSTGAVYVIDVQARQVVQAIQVPSGHYGILFDPDTNEVYVSNADNDTVSVISDSSYSIVATVKVGTFPMGMGVDTTRGLVFVANFVNGTVSAIAEGNHSVVRTVNVGWMPSGVAVDPCTGMAYVSNGDNYTMVEFDTSSYASTPRFVSGSTLGAPLFVPETGQMYVPCVAAGEVAMFAA